jgi:hypothetical protein
MLKKLKLLFKRKRNYIELKITPGEQIRDKIIQLGIQSAEESGYAAGNLTEKILDVATGVGHGLDYGTQLTGGGEAAGALGRVVFKTTRDIARGDKICTGLCLISGTCESMALVCATIKIMPFRGKVYLICKILSRGCISYRNLCAGEGC